MGEQLEFVQFGRQKRDEGMTLVLSHVPESYRCEFIATAQMLATKPASFTSEDITGIVGDPPNSKNTIGALTAECVKMGFMQNIGHVQAKRPSRHAAVIGLYVGVSTKKSIFDD